MISAFLTSFISLLIAFVGHLAAHKPHWIHFSGSILARLFSTVIASTGHAYLHNPHPIQAVEQAFLAVAPFSLEEQSTVTFLF